MEKLIDDSVYEKNLHRVCPIHGEYITFRFGKSEKPCPECQKKLDAEKLKRDKENFLLRGFELKDAKIKSGIPMRYLDASLSDLYNISGREEMEQSVKDFCKHFNKHKKTGKSLFLIGSAGVGKTHLSCGILNALTKSRFNVKYCTLDTLNTDFIRSFKMKPFEAEQTLLKYQVCDLLVIDEIMPNLINEVSNKNLFQCINGRYNYKKCCILITNDKHIDKTLDYRIIDRMKSANGEFLECWSESVRELKSDKI